MEPSLTELIQSGLKMQHATPIPILFSDKPHADPFLQELWNREMEWGGQGDKSKLVIRVSTGTC